MKIFKENLTTLFIPYNSNYPYIDFLIWDKEKKKLIVFQICISLKSEHDFSILNLKGEFKKKIKKKFGEKNLGDKWNKFK
jgi:hypothetical protein